MTRPTIEDATTDHDLPESRAIQELRELVIVRTVDAPRALLYAAWTNAQHFANWFSPRDMGVEVHALDARPGGVIHFSHTFADGRTLYVKGVFRAVEPQARLQFTTAFVDAQGRPAAHPMFPDWPLDAVSVNTVTFEDDPRGSKLTIRQKVTPDSVLASAAVRKERPLSRQGWGETLDRLAEMLRSLS